MPPSPLNLSDTASVIAALQAGTHANLTDPCRRGSVDSIDAAPGERLIATGDLHDNPVNFRALVHVAGMTLNEAGMDDEAPPGPVCHLTLHEIIHSDRLMNGMDMSYRALVRVADLKARFPGHVHTLIGNHELAQYNNSAILKDGVKSVDAFNEGVEFAFPDDGKQVEDAIRAFIRSMPVALECHTPRGTILCAHSLPPPASMGRFDTTILKRDLTDDDFAPRTGSLHLMTWGRGYDAEGLEDLVERWGVYLFILGHEKADDGVKFVPPNAIILASDHERGAFLPIDLSRPPTPEEAVRAVRSIASQIR